MYLKYAAPIGTHHPYQLARQQKIGGLGERLEAREFDGIKAHEKLKTKGGEQAAADPKTGFGEMF